MEPRTLKVELRSKWLRTVTMDMTTPLPKEIVIPILSIGSTRKYKWLFAVINGGAKGDIERVIYIEVLPPLNPKAG